MERLGADLALLRAPIEPIRRLLAVAREQGLHVLFTREGYREDLLGRALVRGEPGWEILPELQPKPEEPVFDKPGYGVFAFTDIDGALRGRGVENLVLTGVTTDCCVHSILREALDRGYDCLVLEDCVGASRREHHDAALSLVRKASGAFGAASPSTAFLQGIAPGGSR